MVYLSEVSPVKEADISLDYRLPQLVLLCKVKCSPVKEADISVQVSPARFSSQPVVEGRHGGILLKYILQFGQIHLAIWTNTFGNLDKHIWQFGEIHLAIWTNSFGNLDK